MEEKVTALVEKQKVFIGSVELTGDYVYDDKGNITGVKGSSGNTGISGTIGNSNYYYYEPEE